MSIISYWIISNQALAQVLLEVLLVEEVLSVVVLVITVVLPFFFQNTGWFW